MNILFYRYGSICEPDLIEQFERIGISVDTIDEELTSKNISVQRRVQLVSEKLLQKSYLFVFSINFFPGISDVCKIHNVNYIGWTVDSPVDELFSKSILNSCNRIFSFDSKQCQYLLEHDVKNVSYLPLGTNVSRWNEVIATITSEDIQKYSADISFVGSLYSDKNISDKLPESASATRNFLRSYQQYNNPTTILEDVNHCLSEDVLVELKKEFSNKFYPSELSIMNMDRFCALNDIIGFHLASIDRRNVLNRLSEKYSVDLYTRSNAAELKQCDNLHIHGGVSTLTEMPKVFHLSKINLNITIPSIEAGIPLRCWDVMGCGGFLITNYQEELDDFLIPGKDYECYKNLDELDDKCKYYLTHEETRKQIALTGYEKVKQYHTYANRMPAIIRSLM